MKGAQYLKLARPDLADMPTNNVQARVTVGICNERGVPECKNRFFVVTARVARQVQMGKGTQDRSAPHPAFVDWNFKGRNLAGKQSIRLRIQHAEIEPAYDIGCICFRAPDAPKPPGRSPYCKSTDMQRAQRWDGTKFANIPCQASACPLRADHTDDRGNRYKPAKDRFVLVGRLDEPGFDQMLVSVATGSDYNFAQFLGMAQGVERQWADMCAKAGASLPFSWYGLPLELTVYESTGDGSRFPRIHYTLACSIEDVFQAMIAFYQRMQGMQGISAGARPVAALPPASELAAESESLDAQEVLGPDEPAPAALQRNASSAATLSAALGVTPQAPAAEPPPPQPEPPQESLADRCRRAQPRQIEALVAEVCDGADWPDNWAPYMALLERCVTIVQAKPEYRAAIARHFADSFEACLLEHPNAAPLFRELGLELAPPQASLEDDDVPFDVDAAASAMAPAESAPPAVDSKAALAALEADLRAEIGGKPIPRDKRALRAILADHQAQANTPLKAEMLALFTQLTA